MAELSQRVCWCSENQLSAFSTDYLVCAACGTLVSQVGLSDKQLAVRDDSSDFYGREYWFTHQEQDLGFKNITIRARLDLSERCLHWLRTVLKYKLPQGKALELGSAHGGFVALLQQAGFEATGLELSSWVVDFARKTFNVPMLLGPVEEQQIEPGTLDVIALMDVLEHLPDPVATMRRCLELLKPDGILVIQTPCYPIDLSYDAMLSTNSPFLEQLKSNEHLYLFSQSSVRKLFQDLKAEQIVFEPAFFDHYDMFLVVSRAPLVINAAEVCEHSLSQTVGGRLVQALLDLDSRAQDLLRRFNEAEKDRVARHEHVQTLTNLLLQSEADRAARLQVIEDQREHIQAMIALSQQLASERDQLASEAELARARWTMLRPTLIGLRNSRIYGIARALGRWDWLEQALDAVLPPQPPNALKPVQARNDSGESKLKRIVVDLTPVLPGGENGGAKSVALGVARHLSRLVPECEFILLTAEHSHDELAFLDAPNARRICVHRASSTIPEASRATWLRMRLSKRLERLLPPRIMSELKLSYRRMFRRSSQPSLLKELDPDLVFCPFTASLFYDPTIPTVAVVYDLQYLYYPQFFSAEDRNHRNQHFTDLCRVATRLICISDYVRETILTNSSVDPDHVKTVYIQLPRPTTTPDEQLVTQLRTRLGLVGERFLLYPANFWQHKNHRVLLTAFGMYHARHPESKLRLALPGSPGPNMAALRQVVTSMRLSEVVLFPGYLADEEFAALLQACDAVIYPSLYEGFGMPLVEAMAFGKPVLCSNLTSLPEIAGDAALLFDPRKPEEIVAAIDRITTDPDLASALIERGYQRLKLFDDPAEMARQYWDVFQEAVGGTRHYTNGMHGVYSDGWTSSNVTVTFGASEQERLLEMVLTAPDWLPHGLLATHIKQNGVGTAESHVLVRGNSVRISRPLPHDGGYIELLIDPVFQPKSLGLNDDDRGLGCLFQECRLVSSAGVIDLLEARN